MTEAETLLEIAGTLESIRWHLILIQIAVFGIVGVLIGYGLGEYMGKK